MYSLFIYKVMILFFVVILSCKLCVGAPLADERLGGCILTQPLGSVPEDLYKKTPIYKVDTFFPFVKRVTVCGITLASAQSIKNTFINNIEDVIESIFAGESSINRVEQARLLTNLYLYNTLIPVVKGDIEDASQAIQNAITGLGASHSVCDIIMNISGHQAMEVVEHIIHHVTDIGLHYTFPKAWGISGHSELGRIMAIAINKGFYKIDGYIEDKKAGEAVYQRILRQEFAYWLITTHWDLQKKYGFTENEEWSIKSNKELKELLPEAHALLVRTVDLVMSAPNLFSA